MPRVPAAVSSRAEAGPQDEQTAVFRAAKLAALRVAVAVQVEVALPGGPAAAPMEASRVAAPLALVVPRALVEFLAADSSLGDSAA